MFYIIKSGIPVYQLLKDKGSKKEDKTSVRHTATHIICIICIMVI